MPLNYSSRSVDFARCRCDIDLRGVLVFKVGFEAEGEARRYFVHALMLRDTVRFLRYNKTLCSEMEAGSAVDLIRCESLLSLEPSTRSRVLQKNYR